MSDLHAIAHKLAGTYLVTGGREYRRTERDLPDLEKLIEAALLEVEQQAYRRAAENVCPRCRSKVPLVMRDGHLMHEYHKNHDYRECHAHSVYALMPVFLLSLAKEDK